MTDLLRRFEGFLDPSSREWELVSRLDSSKLPQHIAVIMDGNGRWAQGRRLRESPATKRSKAAGGD
jgi:undecaprenyl pyrophosphate synthase